MVYCNFRDVCIRDGVNCLPATAEEAKRLAEVIGSQGLHLRILKQYYFIKIFFCELNVEGMVCWTNSCQKKNKKKSQQPFRNGSKHVNLFFPAPKLTSGFAPFCDFQTTIDAYWA